MGIPPNIIKEMVNEMDINRSGKISMDQWVNYFIEGQKK